LHQQDNIIVYHSIEEASGMGNLKRGRFYEEG
jgi:hypothetical protein